MWNFVLVLMAMMGQFCHSQTLSAWPATHNKDVINNILYRSRLGEDLFAEGLGENQQTLHAGSNVTNCPSYCSCDYHYLPGTWIPVLAIGRCSQNPLPDLPKLLLSYKHIVVIYIINAPLTDLPDAILELNQLKALGLSTNHLLRVPPVIFRLEQLMVLQIVNNDISRIPDTITRLPSLVKVSFDNNILASVPDGLGKCSDLIYLTLNGNKIEGLPNDIGTLSKLKSVNLGNNRIRLFPKVISQLSALETLDLSGNEIELIPSGMLHLPLLQLHLNGNKLRTFPKDISNMTLIQRLYLDENFLEYIPWYLPPTLRYLSLSNNSFTEFPCHLITNTLIYLNFGLNSVGNIDCPLTVLDTGFQTLILRETGLTSLPCTILSNNLKDLDVSHNSISILPMSCLTGNALENFDISHNKLKSIRLDVLTASGDGLKLVNFSFNAIKTIDADRDMVDPTSIKEFATVDISYNKLTFLGAWPLSIAAVKPFSLNVSGNQLMYFGSASKEYPPLFKYGTIFRMEGNLVRYFMDILRGWKIRLQLISDLPKVLSDISLRLQGNPLTCDCIDYVVYFFIHRQRTTAYEGLNCKQPLSLKGKDPSYLPLTDFICEIREDCPLGCSCSSIPFTKTVNVTCGDYYENTIPSVVPRLSRNLLWYVINITNQSLTAVTWEPFFNSTSELILSDNNITTVQVNESDIGNLNTLYLDGNSLRLLPKAILGLNNHSRSTTIKLARNPWHCDCETMKFKDWLSTNRRLVNDITAIRCYTPDNLRDYSILGLMESWVCPNENKTIVYVVVTVSLGILLLSLLLCIILRFKDPKLHWLVQDECEGEGKVFDVFVSFATEDEDYITNFLIPGLEQRDFKVCFHLLHFHPGKPMSVNMSEAIQKSKRTLVYFSNNFAESKFGLYEFREAHHLDIQNDTKRLVTIKATDLDVTQLHVTENHYFKTHTHVRQEDRFFWKNLMYGLPKQRLGAELN